MKNIHTNIYLIIVLGFLQVQQCWSQDGPVDFDSSVPSPSGMSTYQDVPVDYCTGIPNISYGLLSLPTASKDFSFNLNLSYHPNNTTVNCKASDVGRGWNWFGVPTISKNARFKQDELTWFEDITPEWAPNALDDVYYYSINGESGKFKFVYDYPTGTVSIKTMTPTLLKFSFVNSSTERLEVNSFQVTDTNGIVYTFGKYDMVKIGYFDTPTRARTNFHLTSANDSNGTQLCSISYNEVYSEFIGSIKEVSINKINEITATGVGKLKFNYETNTSLINKSLDISRLNDISLLTLTNGQVKKCSFNYGASIRTLEGIGFMGTTSTVVESYKFAYRVATGLVYDGDLILGTELVKKHDRFGFQHITNACSIADLIIPKSTFYSNKNTVATGILQKVTLPTGGVIEYDFEANVIDTDGYEGMPSPYFRSTNEGDDFNEALLGSQTTSSFVLRTINPDNWIDLSIPRAEEYYLVNLGHSNYNVVAPDTGKLFQMTQDTELFVHFEGVPNPSPVVPDNELTIGFQIKKGTNVIATYMTHYDPNACVHVSPKIDIEAGWYTIYITSLNGGSVDYTMYARRKNPTPVVNYYAGGVRIKSIKNYENKDATVPIKTLSFEYNDFTTPARSSGTIYFKSIGKYVDTHTGFDSYVLYKNVKVSEDNNGYSKYFFYTPYDFGGHSATEFLYFKAVNGGLLQKREVYDAQHKLLEKDQYYYEMKVGDPVNEYLSQYLVPESSTIIKDYFVKRKYIKSEKYLSGTTPTVMKSVTIANDWNLKPESVTTFDSQDKKAKTRYYYLNEVPSTPYASSLTAKNIVSSPLVVEQYYDGTLMSKAKSEFDSFGNGLFKKAKSYVAKGTGDYTLEQRVSDVDNIANKIREVTNDKGSYTSYIWGYNKTQPVAKIENMAYASIPPALITTIQAATNIANNEANILAALDALRNDGALAGALVTTYTYKPLVGIQSVTDPKGDRVTYEYDAFNRLLRVKDRNGNILTENQYNFRP